MNDVLKWFMMMDDDDDEPESEDKKQDDTLLNRNRDNQPMRVKWEMDITGRGKSPICPSCGSDLDETNIERCILCGQPIVQDDPELQEYLKPAPEERFDCFLCGGVKTVVGTRAKCNGHFHGKCEKCGMRIME